MSDYGEEIINRLPENSSLKNENNPARKVIINTVGEWLDHFDDNFNNLFLSEAEGEFIDVHGKQYGIYRKPDESDENYKKRIIYHLTGHLTADHLIKVYNIDLYVNISDYNPSSNILTSDNYYINGSDGFLIDCDEFTKSVLKKKFVLGKGVKWL